MTEIRLTSYIECLECHRKFEDIDAFDLHMKSTPHDRDGAYVTTGRPLA